MTSRRCSQGQGFLVSAGRSRAAAEAMQKERQSSSNDNSASAAELAQGQRRRDVGMQRAAKVRVPKGSKRSEAKAIPHEK